MVKVPICRASEISIHAPPRGATPPLPMHKQQLMNFNSRPSARGDSASRSPLWHHEFQFTPLREGRHKKSVAVRNGNKFQFTPLREGRLCGFPTTFALQISIHAPPRGATKITWQDWQNEPISIHAPPRGATRGVVLAAIGSIFQFTPLREGRLIDNPEEYQRMVISIHAPPRGATYRRFNRRKSRQSKCISIHAPPRGATCTVWIQRILSAISIHAPPRGATYAVYYVCILPNYFNSRPSARGDDSYMGAVCAKRGFQFTPLREGRHVRTWSNWDGTSISIHAPPRGATGSISESIGLASISIHAPPRGATCPCQRQRKPSTISIHAPPRGATDTARGWGRKRWKFQFTPLREGRQQEITHCQKRGLFQFTPLREGRPLRSTASTALLLFQFTPLREGRRFLFRLTGQFMPFQFTPLREGRLMAINSKARHDLFQFTPLREGRRVKRKFAKSDWEISIHAPPRGATRECGRCGYCGCISIHAPPRGATKQKSVK